MDRALDWFKQNSHVENRGKFQMIFLETQLAEYNRFEFAGIEV